MKAYVVIEYKEVAWNADGETFICVCASEAVAKLKAEQHVEWQGLKGMGVISVNKADWDRPWENSIELCEGVYVIECDVEGE